MACPVAFDIMNGHVARTIEPSQLVIILDHRVSEAILRTVNAQIEAKCRHREK